MGWLSGWQYRKIHTINPASGAGTNYQVKITAHYGSGTDSGGDVYLNSHCRTDFGDVRFTKSDGTTLLDFWMESYTASNNAVFWVEVADDLSTNSATIYIYYGKSDATTTSNGAATFQSFRNLVADEYASWSAVSLTTYGNSNDPGDRFLSSTQVDTVYVSPCIYFRYYGGKKWSLDSSKIHFEAYSDGGNNGECGQDIRMRTSAAPTGWQTSNTYTANATLNRKHILVVDYQMLSSSGGLTYYSTWNVGDDIPSGTVAKSTTLSSTSRVQIEDVITGSASHIKIAVGTGASIDLYAVYHCVAKYVSPEPGHGSWGSEELPVTYVTVADNVGLSDVALRDKAFAISDSVASDDAVLKGGVFSVSDSVSLLDSLLCNKALAVSDNVGLAEVPLKGWTPTVTDAVSLLDAVLRSKAFSILDSVGLADAIYRGKQFAVSDAVALSDFVDVLQRVILKTVLDSVLLSDAVFRDKLVAVADQLGLADFILAHKQLLVADEVLLADLARAVLKLLFVGDAVSLMENVVVVGGRLVWRLRIVGEAFQPLRVEGESFYPLKVKGEDLEMLKIEGEDL